VNNLKINTKQYIDERDFSKFVSVTYGRPYRFQQQDGCRDRGTHHAIVPEPDPEDYEATEIPEEINGETMGVSFAAWLAREPKAPVGDESEPWVVAIFWERNFYPDLGAVLNDLHARGLLDAGEYVLVIDW
jgi:hypothetical protein